MANLHTLSRQLTTVRVWHKRPRRCRFNESSDDGKLCFEEEDLNFLATVENAKLEKQTSRKLLEREGKISNLYAASESVVSSK